jgi:tetratricopeptide (TPR) repeat protein
MPIQADAGHGRRFTAVIPPWVVAAVALGVYLATINRWLSFGSLTQVARLSGWTWQPEVHGPAYWLVTYPLHWLPLPAIPLALNLFSAVCAALCLGLLARSVNLLPHDRTQPQRDKGLGASGCLTIPTAWLPPVLAALVCGLQLTFWENATAASSQFYTGGSNEMFDLLLFAYVTRCLLEFRLDRRESWLIRSAFVYGAAMTNNWAMIGFFPLFLIALVWVKGLSFFKARFLTWLTLSGLAALLLYLLLPLVQSLSDTAMIQFWPALKANLASQRAVLQMLYKFSRQNVMLLGLTSLVPVLIISIRWSSYFGDTSKLGTLTATFMFHAVHAFFLAACIWVALDPPVSPRNKGLGIPFLTFYYLGALSIGYFSGYFLLVFGRKAERPKRLPSYVKLTNSVVTGVIWGLLLLAPAALLYRNLPQILITNGPMLRHYAGLLAEGLPPRGAVVLSDDARRSLLLQSWAAQQGKLKDYLFVDAAGGDVARGTSGALNYPDYHRYLTRRYGQRWPVQVPKGYSQPVDDQFLVQLLVRLAATNSLYYLQPSFGYYFEFFYPEPHGLVYKLKPYPTNTLIAPLPPKNVIAENESFWARAGDKALNPMLRAIAQTDPLQKPGLVDRFLELAHLAKEPNQDADVLAGFYSRALNFWGVELQKSGHLTNAAAMFGRALELNPDNLVAQVNQECNKNLQSGHESTVQIPRSVEDEFGKYRSWDTVIGENGPFDEPNFSFEQARTFVRNNLHHQAAQQFDRVRALVPRSLLARIWLAQLYVVNRLPAPAMQLVREIRAHPVLFPVPSTNRTEMLFAEASTYLANNDLEGAEATVATALKKYPDDDNLLGTATQVYINFQCYSNALATVEQQLRISPTNQTALVNKGNVCIWLGAYDKAIPPLTRALTVDSNNPYALMNRGIANLRCGNLDDAQQDYEVLQKLLPTSSRVNYGLQEVAYRKKDTNAAIRYCQIYMANAQTNTAEALIVRERLKELRPGPR